MGFSDPEHAALEVAAYQIDKPQGVLVELNAGPVPAVVTGRPKRACLVMDGSGSMSGGAYATSTAESTAKVSRDAAARMGLVAMMQALPPGMKIDFSGFHTRWNLLGSMTSPGGRGGPWGLVQKAPLPDNDGTNILHGVTQSIAGIGSDTVYFFVTDGEHTSSAPTDGEWRSVADAVARTRARCVFTSLLAPSSIDNLARLAADSKSVFLYAHDASALAASMAVQAEETMLTAATDVTVSLTPAGAVPRTVRLPSVCHGPPSYVFFPGMLAGSTVEVTAAGLNFRGAPAPVPHRGLIAEAEVQVLLSEIGRAEIGRMASVENKRVNEWARRASEIENPRAEALYRSLAGGGRGQGEAIRACASTAVFEDWGRAYLKTFVSCAGLGGSLHLWDPLTQYRLGMTQTRVKQLEQLTTESARETAQRMAEVPEMLGTQMAQLSVQDRTQLGIDFAGRVGSPQSCVTEDVKVEVITVEGTVTYMAARDVFRGVPLRGYDADGKYLGLCPVAYAVFSSAPPGTRLCRLFDQSDEFPGSITQWHPMRHRLGEKWYFPAMQIASAEAKSETVLVSFVFTNPEVAGYAIAGPNGPVIVAAMGHTVTEGDAVLAHPFFGARERVLAELEALDTKKNSVLPIGGLRRDPRTGLADGFLPASK